MSLSTRHLRQHRFTALEPGPRLIVTGAVHGNETAGTRGIERVVREIERGEIVGLDKQPLRDWLASTGVTGGAEQAALDLPEDVILGVYERYARAYTLLTGRTL